MISMRCWSAALCITRWETGQMRLPTGLPSRAMRRKRAGAGTRQRRQREIISANRTPLLAHGFIFFHMQGGIGAGAQRFAFAEFAKRPDGHCPYERRGIVDQLPCFFGEGRFARIANRDQHIAHETIAPRALDRGAGEEGAKARIIKPHQLRKQWCLQFLSGMKGAFARGLRELVPGADGKTIIATVNPVAHRLAKLARDMPFFLDGEIGDAAPRIEFVRRGERPCRASIKAAMTRAAMIVMRRIGRDVERGEDRTEKEPGTKFSRHEICVLALPAKPGRLRE